MAHFPPPHHGGVPMQGMPAGGPAPPHMGHGAHSPAVGSFAAPGPAHFGAPPMGMMGAAGPFYPMAPPAGPGHMMYPTQGGYPMVPQMASAPAMAAAVAQRLQQATQQQPPLPPDAYMPPAPIVTSAPVDTAVVAGLKAAALARAAEASPAAGTPAKPKEDATVTAMQDAVRKRMEAMLKKGGDAPASPSAASAPAPAPAAAAPAPAAAKPAPVAASLAAAVAAAVAEKPAAAGAGAPAAQQPASPAPSAASAAAPNPLGGAFVELDSIQERRAVKAEDAEKAAKETKVLKDARAKAVAVAGGRGKTTFSIDELGQMLERISDLLHASPSFRLPAFKYHELVEAPPGVHVGGGGHRGGDRGDRGDREGRGGKGYEGGGDGDWKRSERAGGVDSPRYGRDGGGRGGDREYGRDRDYGRDRRGGGGRYGRGGDRDRYDEYDAEEGTVEDYNRLQRAANPYRRDVALDPLGQLAKEATGIMNKISRETFEKLSESMLGLNVTSQEMLEKIIDVVFDKALDDPFFQDLYADLCKRLGDRAVVWSDRYLQVAYLKEKDGAPAGDAWYIDLTGGLKEWQGPYETEAEARTEGRHLTNFKRLLLNRCQQEFMAENKYKPLDAEATADKAEADALREAGTLTAPKEAELAARAEVRANKRGLIKRRMLSNISFIGHLYKIDVLTAKIMHYCVGKLLAQGQVENTDDESIEALCKLLELIGGKLEREDAGSEAPRFGLYVTLLERLARGSHLAKRVQFGVQDVLDMRRAGWKLMGSKASLERKAETLTRDQLRKKLEEDERARESAAASGGRGGTPSGIPGGRGLMSSLRAPSGGARPGGMPAQTGPVSRGPARFGPKSGAAGAAPAAAAGGRPSPLGAAPATTADGWTTVAPGRGVKPAAGEAGAAAPGAAGEGAEGAAADAAAAAPAGEVLEGDALFRRLRGVLEEFAALKSTAELETSIKEVAGSPAWSAVLLQTALTASLASKGDYREGVAAALAHLASAGLLVKQEALDGFKAFAPAFNDAAADAPKLAELIAPVSDLCGCCGCGAVVACRASFRASRNVCTWCCGSACTRCVSLRSCCFRCT